MHHTYPTVLMSLPFFPRCRQPRFVSLTNVQGNRGSRDDVIFECFRRLRRRNPSKDPKKFSPKSIVALRPTLHVRLMPGMKVFTWIWTNFVPPRLLHRMSVFGEFPSVTVRADTVRPPQKIG
jgi:hypothetical protein